MMPRTKCNLVLIFVTTLMLASCGGATAPGTKTESQLDADGFKWLSPPTWTDNSVKAIYPTRFEANDPGEWQFSLSGADSQYFEIDPKTGVASSLMRVTNDDRFDADRDGYFDLTITAFNSKGASHQISVRTRIVTGTDFYGVKNAQILFPPPNANLGLGVESEITLVLKVDYYDGSPDRSFSGDANGIRLTHVENSQGLWTAKVPVKVGKNKYDIKVNQNVYSVNLYNNVPDSPAKIHEVTPFAKGCGFGGYDSMGSNVFLGSSWATDTKNWVVYYPASEYVCSYDLVAKQHSRSVQPAYSNVYPVMTSVEDRQFLYTFNWDGDINKYNTISKKSNGAVNYKKIEDLGTWDVPTALAFDEESNQFAVVDFNRFYLINLADGSTRVLMEDEIKEEGDLMSSVAVDWKGEKAYLSSGNGTLIEKDLNGPGKKTLLKSATPSNIVSSAYRKYKNDLILGGKDQGGLASFDPVSGMVSSLVEQKGAGLNIKYSFHIELDDSENIAFLQDKAQGYFFVVSLLTGDRVVIDNLSFDVRN
ncbi:MAG: hypothetical protein U1F46_02720 [Marinagarivorans sp.]